MPDDAARLRAADTGLRSVVEAKYVEIALLRAGLEAAQELERRLELRLAELERRLGMDSTDSGTPSSKEPVGAKEARKARQQSERERRRDRNRGGQPGHQGKGLQRDPDPGERKDAAPPAECRSCRASLDGADAVEPRWAQVIDVEFLRKVTELAMPGLSCPCCGTVTFAEPPPGAHQGSVSYGPALNAAAVVLASYGNVPPERAAQVIGMLLGTEVSAGWVDKAAARVNAQLKAAGFDEAMIAALAAGGVLAADESAAGKRASACGPTVRRLPRPDPAKASRSGLPDLVAASAGQPARGAASAASVRTGGHPTAVGRRVRLAPAANTTAADGRPGSGGSDGVAGMAGSTRLGTAGWADRTDDCGRQQEAWRPGPRPYPRPAGMGRPRGRWTRHRRDRAWPRPSRQPAASLDSCDGGTAAGIP